MKKANLNNADAPDRNSQMNEGDSRRWYEIKGNSFLPFGCKSCITLVDKSKRDLDLNIGCLIAVATAEGIEARRLRKIGPTYFVEQLHGDSDPQMVRPVGEFSVIGRIVQITAIPSEPRVTADQTSERKRAVR